MKSQHNKFTKDNTYAEKQYEIANIYRVFFARLFDLFLLAIPFIVVNAVCKPKQGEWIPLIIIVSSSFVFTVIYFIIIPYFLKGNTLGKLLLQIRLKQKGKRKPDLLPLFLRESYFLLIPWLVALIFQIITVLLLQNSDKNSQYTIWILLLLRNVGFIFYGLWLFFVGISIKLQKTQQASIDLKFHIYVVYKEEFKGWVKPNKDKVMTNQDTHVSLKAQPGNLSKEQIEEIQNIEHKGETNE
ncbi:RDD family protein [Williamsoniiplasma lucivorax]|uniref:RDD domain-containing protein n=1 Tax=Williamsoniiplasma lucivorax TaxID=209274 RepID=A0A2S5RA12_9MOLU|nr:RDD family protein [Williamsoniiplasma lucivorax]PPE04166.1 hypothetical protein ELUCI_v1c09460 [Williamsoniiplasma lucivorax]